MLHLNLGSDSPSVKMAKAPKRYFFGAVNLFMGKARVPYQLEIGWGQWIGKQLRSTFQRLACREEEKELLEGG